MGFVAATQPLPISLRSTASRSPRHHTLPAPLCLPRCPRSTLTCLAEGGQPGGEQPDQTPSIDEDWRSFRARLVAGEAASESEETRAAREGGAESQEARSPLLGQKKERWAHEVSAIERGCLLVASPSSFNDAQSYFAETVIFLVEHNESGTIGVVLNRPISYALKELGLSGQAANEIVEAFPDSAMYSGGPVAPEAVMVMHNESSFDDAIDIIPGVRVGGIESAIRRVKDDKVDPQKLRFFCGYSGWYPGQLQGEVDRGLWFVAASSPDIATDQCIKLAVPLWRQVLTLMGGKYRQMAERG
mmetsp:Transcript_44413/g.109031  ORF Transcript_44413/g.109031 Transcript_44413/m.109031 type:complete len:302 (-) Transcript_44413:245-1150(-)